MYLACDLGSTFLKAAVCDASGAPLRRHAVRISYDLAPGGSVELPVKRFDDALDELIAGLSLKASPSAIAITSQAQTFAVCAANGSARSGFISWQDTSAAGLRHGLAEDARLDNFAAHSSFPEVHPQQMLCQVARMTRAGGIGPDDRLVPLPSRMIEHLGGEARLDANLAAMTGLFSMTLDGWWPAALAVSGITASQLPTISRPGRRASVSGQAGIRLGITPGTPIVLAGNDQSAGAYAARVHRGAGRLIGLGTAQVAYRWLPKMPPPTPGLVRGHFPGGGAYLMAVDAIGGNAITWAAKHFDLSADELLRLALSAPRGSGGIRFAADPDLGTGAGTWIGGGPKTGTAEHGRAVVEHLAGRMETMLDRLGGDGNLLVTGSEDKAAWCAIFAQQLGQSLHPVVADSLLGAAGMLLEEA